MYHERDSTGRDTIEDFVRGEDQLDLNIQTSSMGYVHFADFDTNSSGSLDDGDAFVRIENVAYNGLTKLSTVIDASGAISQAGELSLVLFGVTGITASDFLYG